MTGLGVFVVGVVIEHLVNPGLSPSRHQVSEYVNRDAGGLMVAAFLAWAASLAATVAWAGQIQPQPRLLMVSLVVASCGLFVAACFPTQTSAGELPPGTV